MFRQEQYENAVQWFQEVLVITDDSVKRDLVFRTLALCWYYQGEEQKVIEYLDNISGHSSAGAHFLRFRVALMRDDGKAAEEALKELTRAEDFESTHLLCCAGEASGNESNAVASLCFQKLLENAGYENLDIGWAMVFREALIVEGKLGNTSRVCTLSAQAIRSVVRILHPSSVPVYAEHNGPEILAETVRWILGSMYKKDMNLMLKKLPGGRPKESHDLER